jgi:hypothetical protein
VHVLESTTLNLTCTAAGNPTPSVHWMLVGDDTTATPATDRTATLHITNVSRTQTGTYRCTAVAQVQTPEMNEEMLNQIDVPVIVQCTYFIRFLQTFLQKPIVLVMFIINGRFCPWPTAFKYYHITMKLNSLSYDILT